MNAEDEGEAVCAGLWARGTWVSSVYAGPVRRAKPLGLAVTAPCLVRRPHRRARPPRAPSPDTPAPPAGVTLEIAPNVRSDCVWLERAASQTAEPACALLAPAGAISCSLLASLQSARRDDAAACRDSPIGSWPTFGLVDSRDRPASLRSTRVWRAATTAKAVCLLIRNQQVVRSIPIAGSSLS